MLHAIFITNLSRAFHIFQMLQDPFSRVYIIYRIFPVLLKGVYHILYIPRLTQGCISYTVYSLSYSRIYTVYCISYIVYSLSYSRIYTVYCISYIVYSRSISKILNFKWLYILLWIAEVFIGI